jgi:hypothetical protein
VSLRAEEQHRITAIAAVDVQHRPHVRVVRVRAGDVHRDLTAPVRRQLTPRLARVDERQADAGRLVEQRPQLRAAVADIERPVGGGVVVAAAPLPRALRRVQLAHQRHVVGAVIAGVAVPRVQRTPRQRAVDPAASRTRAHQPRH